MDAKMLKIENTAGFSPMYENDDDFSDDDEIIYSDETQSDNDYDESCTGNESKRLKSLYHNTAGNLFRNCTKMATNSKKAANDKKLSIKRMPTRKPDPKVSNRNAIMARENRRKKKEHMEVLQKTVEDTQNENKKLKKMLCIRNNTITKLTQESLYLRSILANKTEIMSLLRSIQGNRTPITSSVLSFVADNEYQEENKMHHSSIMRSRLCKNSSSSSGCSPASASSMSPASYEDDKENDLENGSHTDFTATESTSSYEQNIDDFHWENLLNEPVTSTAFKTDLNPMNIADLREIDDSEILSG
ncbi:uncharacterized protein LOC116346991 isoform X2 [Contarinia nasturtii]|uniref:uncharacterized protein LOC116346991 isoform X2 n=1 Tax=Contarinia nasturtii TaxID=265458 RepID=UPI0012D48D0A|nr:uncharacterized protein LOC116346991 isoform X2 [Contarinia nasturtii]